MFLKNLIIGVFSLALLVSLTVKPQKVDQSETYFVQFKILTVDNVVQATQIDKEMRARLNIEVSRTDHNTSTYFCVLNHGSVVDQEIFEDHFKDMGYEISCFSSGIQFVDRVIPPQTLKNCQDEK